MTSKSAVPPPAVPGTVLEFRLRPSACAFRLAGQGVMAALEHLPIDRITLAQSEDVAGCVDHDGFYMTENEAYESGIIEWEQLRAEKSARVILAGDIAEQMHNAPSVNPKQLAIDHDKLSAMILRLASSPDEQEAYAKLLRLQTQNALRRNRGAVEKVAGLLMTQKTIDGTAVKEVVWPGISKVRL